MKTSLDTLNQVIKPFLHNHLDVKGVQKITAYLYGDEIAALMGAGRCWHALLCRLHTCGYYLIQYYLEKTGKTIEEAESHTGFWTF